MTSKKPRKTLLTSDKDFPFERKRTPVADVAAFLPSESYSHPDDDEVNEHLEGFLKAISKAIGQHHLYKDITDKQRTDFASTIYEEIQYLVMQANDEKRLNTEKKILLDKAEFIKKHLTDFLLYQRKTRSSFKAITPLLPFLHESNAAMPLNEAWWRLDDYIKELTKVPIEVKRGPQNQVESSVAKFVVSQFEEHFRKTPSTSKGSITTAEEYTPNDTPFDEVCNEIYNYFNIEIAYSTRVAAIKAMKNETNKTVSQ